MQFNLQIKDNKIFSPLTQKWLVKTPEEEEDRQKYILTLVNEYGYSLNQMRQEVQVNNAQRGLGRAMADIVIWKSLQDKKQNKCPGIVVECKGDYLRILEEDYFQGFNYACCASSKAAIMGGGRFFGNNKPQTNKNF